MEFIFFFKVIVLVLEVQIYCSFSLRCFSLSIIIRHIKLKIYYWICFPYTSKISLYILKFYGLEGPSQRVRQRTLEIIGPALLLRPQNLGTKPQSASHPRATTAATRSPATTATCHCRRMNVSMGQGERAQCPSRPGGQELRHRCREDLGFSRLEKEKRRSSSRDGEFPNSV